MDFAPEQWAHVMKDAGMKYMIFTTKHHDGFCMFDSDYTDFTIADGPFAGDPRSDVALHVFDAFRKEGFMTGFYFSKPDWHCKWYWNPYFATPRRIQNYNIEKHPDWWRNYVEFTQNQLRELMTRYGRCDILWLDGGMGLRGGNRPGQHPGICPWAVSRNDICGQAHARQERELSDSRAGCAGDDRMER